MNLPVLLGGRRPLEIRSEIPWGIAVWLPAAIMVAAISTESTATFSSAHTSGWIRHTFEQIFGHVKNEHWDLLHHYIRKTGHFFGFGTTCLAFLRAYLHTWLRMLHRQPAFVWRTWSAAAAVSSTMLVASLDELHQSFIPQRTGMATDVLLDTAGAVAMLLLVTLLSLALPGNLRHTRKSV